jgi:hypothetical protein
MKYSQSHSSTFLPKISLSFRIQFDNTIPNGLLRCSSPVKRTRCDFSKNYSCTFYFWLCITCITLFILSFSCYRIGSTSLVSYCFLRWIIFRGSTSRIISYCFTLLCVILSLLTFGSSYYLRRRGSIGRLSVCYCILWVIISGSCNFCRRIFGSYSFFRSCIIISSFIIIICLSKRSYYAYYPDDKNYLR